MPSPRYHAVFMLAPLALLCASPASAPARQDRGQEARVEAVGLVVNRAVDQVDAAFPEMAIFGIQDRTQLALQLHWPAGGIVELIEEESVLTAFGDDRGTDLIDGQEAFGPFGPGMRRARDGRSVVFTLASDRQPDAAARELRAAGAAVLLVSDRALSARGEIVDLEPGARLAAGPYQLTIEEVSEFGDGWAITLESAKDPRAIHAWSLWTADGQEHELREVLAARTLAGWRRMLVLGERPLRGALAIEYWDEPRRVPVPFEVRAGVGLR